MIQSGPFFSRRSQDQNIFMKPKNNVLSKNSMQMIHGQFLFAIKNQTSGDRTYRRFSVLLPFPRLLPRRRKVGLGFV